MKTILKIARTELALLFYSPIAWFLLIAFLFECGLAYTSALEPILTSQQMGGRGLKYLVFLTARTFAPSFGIWPSLAGKLYLYLPLLTMGLMSREVNAGTIKLLYSSPIKVREIIFGKYVAMMIYNLLLVLILALLVLLAVLNIHSTDTGLLISGLLGIYLLLCVYAAIGLFMSCLTSYQVVAALSTLVVLAILSYIGTLWQDIDFVRDLSHFLSITGRAEHMLMGLISTRDVLYFAVIALMFLGFSIYKLQSDRESKPFLVKAGRYVLIVVCTLAVGYITSRPGLVGYIDTTATKTQTLTVNAQKVLKEMGDTPVEVTAYINLLDGRFYFGGPAQRNQFLARWEPYLRFKPNIKFNFVYYYDSTNANLFRYNEGVTLAGMADKYAKSMKIDLSKFKTPAEIHQIIDLRPEQNRLVMQLKYKDRTTFLRLYNDNQAFPSETETSAAFKRLMQDKMPMIAFAQGESERSIEKAGDRHFKSLTNEITFRYSLVNQGFDVEKVYLKDQDIPKGITALVIADPKIAFDTTSMRKIEVYIAGGGNLLIAGEPGKQDVLNPILKLLGVQMMDGMLVQPGKNASPEVAQPYVTSAAAGFTKSLHDDYMDSTIIAMHGAAALSYTTGGPFTITPLAMTPAGNSWNKKIKPDEEMIELADDVEAPPSNGVAVMIDNGSGVSASFVPNGNVTPSASRPRRSIGTSVKPAAGPGKPVVASDAASSAAPVAAPSAAPVAAPGAVTAAPTAGPVRHDIHPGLRPTGKHSGARSASHPSSVGGTADSAWQGLQYDAAKGDQKGPLPTVLGLTRNINGRQQRIVVAGDADFLSNASLGQSAIQTCNFDFSTAIFSWFANGEFPIETTRPPSRDTRLDLTDGKLYFLKVLLMGILPGLLLIIGSILLIRRKRK